MSSDCSHVLFSRVAAWSKFNHHGHTLILIGLWPMLGRCKNNASGDDATCDQNHHWYGNSILWLYSQQWWGVKNDFFGVCVLGLRSPNDLFGICVLGLRSPNSACRYDELRGLFGVCTRCLAQDPFQSARTSDTASCDAASGSLLVSSFAIIPTWWWSAVSVHELW